MKTKILFSALLIGILFTACKKNETPAPTESSTTPSWAAKVNGTDYTWTDPKAEIFFTTKLMVSASCDKYTSQIFIKDYKTKVAGTYRTEDDFNANIMGSDGFRFTTASEGQFVISKIDQTNRKISGTFNYKITNHSGGDSLTVTGGVFNNLSW